MATWVSLVVAAAERAQLPHVACSEWSLATHVRDSAPESSRHSSFRSELDSSALLLSSARCCGMVQHHESTPCLANALSVMYEEQVSAFAAANMSQARAHAPSLRILHHIRMCPGAAQVVQCAVFWQMFWGWRMPQGGWHERAWSLKLFLNQTH